jgi:hypothetical protein
MPPFNSKDAEPHRSRLTSPDATPAVLKSVEEVHLTA